MICEIGSLDCHVVTQSTNHMCTVTHLFRNALVDVIYCVVHFKIMFIPSLSPIRYHSLCVPHIQRSGYCLTKALPQNFI